MIKKQFKNLLVFVGLLIISTLFLAVSLIPQIISRWPDIKWDKLLDNSEHRSSILAVLLALSVLVIIFMYCVKIISKAISILKEPEYPEFIEIDRSTRGCKSVMYGYNVPIATINVFYSQCGKITSLVKKYGVAPILSRRRQLIYQSALLSDFLSCISALLLSLVTAFITGEDIQNLSSFDVVFAAVVIGICVSSIFLRPVIFNSFQSKYNEDTTRYELIVIDQYLSKYNHDLDLQNIEHCGKKEQRLKIKKLQKELELQKSRSKKKRILADIRLLEAGGRIPHQKKKPSNKSGRD